MKRGKEIKEWAPLPLLPTQRAKCILYLWHTQVEAAHTATRIHLWKPAELLFFQGRVLWYKTLSRSAGSAMQNLFLPGCVYTSETKTAGAEYWIMRDARARFLSLTRSLGCIFDAAGLWEWMTDWVAHWRIWSYRRVAQINFASSTPWRDHIFVSAIWENDNRPIIQIRPTFSPRKQFSLRYRIPGMKSKLTNRDPITAVEKCSECFLDSHFFTFLYKGKKYNHSHSKNSYQRSYVIKRIFFKSGHFRFL